MRNYSGGGGSSVLDWHGFYQQDTARGGQRYYPPALLYNDEVAAGAVFIQNPDVLYAWPLLSTRGVTITGLHTVIGQVDAGHVIRVGIYDAVDDETDLYPNNLLIDAGTFDGSSLGLKSLAFSFTLEAGKLYWLASISDGWVLPNGPNGAGEYWWGILGSPDMINRLAQRWQIARAYGALPNPFPAGATANNGSVPLICFTL